MVRFIAALLLLLSLLSSCSVSKQIKKADKRYAVGEYFKAANVYKGAYPRLSVTKEKQKKAYVAYMMGICYAKVGEYEKAERAFAGAIRYKHTNPDVYLRYADILRRAKKYKESIQNYDIYMQLDTNSLLALNGKLAAIESAEREKAGSRYVVKKEDFFSSKKSDGCPVHPEGDSTIIYFSSSRDNKQTSHKTSNITGAPSRDIYMARRNAVGRLDNLELLEGDINTQDDESTPSFSADGKTIVFTRCPYVKGETHGAEIWTATRQGGKWGKSSRLALLKDSTVTVAHPALSSDGKYLYFVSDMEGGFGGKDIWRSMKTDDGWSAPVNLGEDINTEGDEMFPSVRDSLLYFSSDGHPGMGGLDIFYATEANEGQWVVTAMPAPVNSNADDYGITFVKGEEKGFFSTNRNEKKGYDKIYSFYCPPIVYKIVGKVTSTDGDPLGDANVRVVGDDGTNVKLKTKKDGTYHFDIKRGVNYVMLGNSRGFLNQKNNISTHGLEESKQFDINFVLASISKPVGLDNIFFEFGRATLTKESGAALDKLIKLLKDNPNITIEIGAHTDKVGSAEGNLKLSGERARSVVDYLIKGGIEEARLTAMGYGKTKPVVVDKNLTKQYSFLKENDVLDEEFIDALTPENQEIANMINRRTEFRVLKTTYKMY